MCWLWLTVWLDSVGFLSNKGAIRNIMQNLTISSNINVYTFIISVQTSITKTCKIPRGCKPFQTIHYQMRCPCSMHFFCLWPWFRSPKKNTNSASLASLFVMFFFFWPFGKASTHLKDSPPKKMVLQKALSCSHIFFKDWTEEPWNQRFCRQNPRNPRHLVLEHMVVNGWGGRGRTGGVYWVGPWLQNIVFHMR